MHGAVCLRELSCAGDGSNASQQTLLVQRLPLDPPCANDGGLPSSNNSEAANIRLAAICRANAGRGFLRYGVGRALAFFGVDFQRVR